MDRGTILFHRQLQYHDGPIGQKLLILLNAPKKSQPYLFCKTTSQPKHVEREGCHHTENLYVLNANADSFPLKTWVQFHELYELSDDELVRTRLENHWEKKGQLRDQTITAILNCIKKSEDVSAYHLSLLG